DGIRIEGNTIIVPELKPKNRIAPNGKLGGTKCREAIKQVSEYGQEVGKSNKGMKVVNQLWSYVKIEGSKKFKYVKEASWVKKIPVVGTVLGAFMFAQTAEAKGTSGAASDLLLDAIPGKGIVELVTGEDIVPNKCDDPRNSQYLPPSIQ